jgi:hypothetical protein
MIKDDTYCANCHWQYCKHFGAMAECPTPWGAKADVGSSYFEVPIHGSPAVEAVDAEEELFDVYAIWHAQKIGLMVIGSLAVLIAVLGGVYIGHFVWLTP